MLRFMQFKAGSESEALVSTEKMTEDINQNIRNALSESSYKMLETLKEMKAKAQKKVEKVESLKAAFLETIRSASAGDLVDLTAHASLFDNDIKNCYLEDDVSEQYDQV